MCFFDQSTLDSATISGGVTMGMSVSVAVGCLSDIVASIRIRQEIQCLLYEGFILPSTF